MISSKVIADSVSELGLRITTLQLRYPRFVHSEFMTHRVFSRNAASSRAIPIKKMIEQVANDPAMPVFWGKNQSGMQAREELEYHPPRTVHYDDGHQGHYGGEYVIHSPRDMAMFEWKAAREDAIRHAERMIALGVHKQIVNRLLEPWQWMQTIVTATEWDNFYKLRRHADAQPEIKALADEMFISMEKSSPKQLHYGQWHLPYVTEGDVVFYGGLTATMDEMKKWSTARCARVSYLTHDNNNPLIEKDEELHDKLLQSGHFSPFEHQAQPWDKDQMFANFRGWMSYRTQLGF